jgi:hypothetical protein
VAILITSSVTAQVACPCDASWGAIIVNNTNCTNVIASFTFLSDGECKIADNQCVSEGLSPCQFTYNVHLSAATNPDSCCSGNVVTFDYSSGKLDSNGTQSSVVTAPTATIGLGVTLAESEGKMPCNSFQFFQFNEFSSCPPVDPFLGYRQTILVQFSKNCANCL